MESKRFEIKMSKTVWCAKNIENCLQIHHKGTVKVTELPTNFCYAPMSVEYCECNIPLSNQEKETMVCNCCGKSIKSKSPIEKLHNDHFEPFRSGELLPLNMLHRKQCEIIDWIENQSKEAK